MGRQNHLRSTVTLRSIRSVARIRPAIPQTMCLQPTIPKVIGSGVRSPAQSAVFGRRSTKTLWHRLKGPQVRQICRRLVSTIVSSRAVPEMTSSWQVKGLISSDRAGVMTLSTGAQNRTSSSRSTQMERQPSRHLGSRSSTLTRSRMACLMCTPSARRPTRSRPSGRTSSRAEKKLPTLR